MENLYSETFLHARPTFKRILLRSVLLAICVVMGVMAVLSVILIQSIIPACMLVGIILIIAFLIPTNRIDYEYIFVDGQIDFDRILKGEKRKTMKRIDFEKVEVVAPEKSHALDSYQNGTIYDYSSGISSDKHYIVVHLGEKGLERIRFTPDEKMLEKMKMKARSKMKD